MEPYPYLRMVWAGSIIPILADGEIKVLRNQDHKTYVECRIPNWVWLTDILPMRHKLRMIANSLKFFKIPPLVRHDNTGLLSSTWV